MSDMPTNGPSGDKSHPPGIPQEVDFFDDSPGDTTVRPGKGRAGDFVQQERVRRALYQNWLKEKQKAGEEKTDESQPPQQP